MLLFFSPDYKLYLIVNITTKHILIRNKTLEVVPKAWAPLAALSLRLASPGVPSQGWTASSLSLHLKPLRHRLSVPQKSRQKLFIDLQPELGALL